MRAIAALALAAALLAGCAMPVFRDTSVPISSAAGFDPARYTGLWYEIARFPVRFQEGCVGVTAAYEPRDDGTLGVVNTCRDSLDGGTARQIAGFAEVVGPGRLKVRLDGVPVAADYWVLWTDDTYETAVVAVPSGRAGWVLSRTPDLREDRWRAALRVLEFNGFDIAKLERTPQGS